VHISFHLMFQVGDTLETIRQDTQQFIEALEKWRNEQYKLHDSPHEIYVYVNQR